MARGGEDSIEAADVRRDQDLIDPVSGRSRHGSPDAALAPARSEAAPPTGFEPVLPP